MITPGLAAFLMLSGGGVADSAPAIETETPVRYAQLTIRERVIVRVPTRLTVIQAKPVRWKESKGPKCAPMAGVAGAAVVKPDSVDLIFRNGGGRLRAELQDECPALDFYSGFYVRPTADARICAGRDSIHARSGGECQIRRFRKLTAVPAKD